MTLPTPADEDLVLAVRRGDRDAFDRLARAHVPRLFGAARALLRDAAEAEEAVADALLKIHGALGRLRDPKAFAAWAHAVVCRTALDRLRRRRGDAASLDQRAAEPAASSRAPWSRLEARERLSDVRRAIDRLPEAQRLAVVLHLWEGLDYAAVAELLGTSYDAVRVNVAHARRRLRGALERAERREGAR